jgi:4'-phosphopantetheinyl transferase
LTDAQYLESKSPHKIIEFLSSRLAIRYLAKELNIEFDGIKKDVHGKPYLVNSSWQMSITHSRKLMGVVLHPKKAVGVDIERPQSKMWKILPRLFSKQEIVYIGDNLERMSVYWSAKEALYKLYGKRGTDFRENLLIHSLEDELFGEISMPDHQKKHQLFHEKIDEYLVVWAI